MAAAITFDNVTKHFRGGKAHRYRALRDDIVSLPKHVFGGDRPQRAIVRALESVNFAVEEGESFGLIGPNGAGKTTALKIATRVSYPTKGRVRVRGRVGALIEVGTGMHPELTGRENVQLYGRILGLRRREIDRRFDEIVEFSGISSAIDQPVKQFSSGMQLRLGFSIASHLDTDVLLVDEALAVGDAGFQYRCVEKMASLVREGGTLVFVSHDMGAIESLCKRAVLLTSGRITAEGPAREVVAHYLQGVDQQQLGIADRRHVLGLDVELVGVTVLDSSGQEVDSIAADEPVTVRVSYLAHSRIEQPHFSVGFGDGRRGAFASASMLVEGRPPDVIEGAGHVDCRFEGLPFYPRVYEIWCGIHGPYRKPVVRWQRVRLLEVTDLMEAGKVAASRILKTSVRLPHIWHTDDA